MLVGMYMPVKMYMFISTSMDIVHAGEELVRLPWKAALGMGLGPVAIRCGHPSISERFLWHGQYYL